MLLKHFEPQVLQSTPTCINGRYLRSEWPSFRFRNSNKLARFETFQVLHQTAMVFPALLEPLDATARRPTAVMHLRQIAGTACAWMFWSDETKFYLHDGPVKV